MATLAEELKPFGDIVHTLHRNVQAGSIPRVRDRPPKTHISSNFDSDESVFLTADP